MTRDVRKGMPPRKLAREAFEQRFKSRFIDPAFAPLQRLKGTISYRKF